MHFSHTLVRCSKQNRLVTTRHLHSPIARAGVRAHARARADGGTGEKRSHCV